MGPRGRLALVVGLLGLLGAAACGDDETDGTVKPPPESDGGAGDGGRDDGGVDGSLPADASQGGGDDDAGTGAADGGDAGDAGDSCEKAGGEDVFEQDVPFEDEGGFGFAPAASGFGLAYQNEVESCTGIWGLPVSGAGAVPEPLELLHDCYTFTELGLVHMADGWRMVWVDNSNGSAELQTMKLLEDMSEHVGLPRTRLTTNTLRERYPVVADINGHAFTAVIATDPETSKARILGRGLDGGASVIELVPESAGHLPSRLALTQIGANHALLAWIDLAPDKQGIWIQRLDLIGMPLGEPQRVGPAGAFGNAIDFATRSISEGGALLYSISLGGADAQEVRFQRLSDTGTLLGDEVKIVSAPLLGRDASFTRVGGGYVVAYRALPSATVATPQIRFTTITPEGTPPISGSGALVSYLLAEAGSSGGRITVRLSNDGYLMAGFLDGNFSPAKLRVVQRRLDCGE